MKKNQIYGRVRYDEETDSFIYEISSDRDPEWGMCLTAKCHRREGAEEGEGTNYIPFTFMKQIVYDCDVYGAKVHIMRQ